MKGSWSLWAVSGHRGGLALLFDVVASKVDAGDRPVGLQRICQGLAQKSGAGLKQQRCQVSTEHHQGLAALVSDRVVCEVDLGEGAIDRQCTCQGLTGKSGALEQAAKTPGEHHRAWQP